MSLRDSIDRGGRLNRLPLAGAATMTGRQIRRVFAGLVIVALVATAAACWLARGSESTAPTKRRAPYGPPVRIEAPVFKEADPRWAADALDGSRSTLGRGGCAVCSAAMMLAHFGVDTDPGRLNRFLSANGGYASGDLIVWDKLVEYSQGRIREVYRGGARAEILERNLAAGNPVMAKVLIRGRTQHWVLVVGTDGPECLANDPLGAEASPVRLSRYGERIYALRVFAK